MTSARSRSARWTVSAYAPKSAEVADIAFTPGSAGRCAERARNFSRSFALKSAWGSVCAYSMVSDATSSSRRSRGCRNTSRQSYPEDHSLEYFAASQIPQNTVTTYNPLPVRMDAMMIAAFTKANLAKRDRKCWTSGADQRAMSSGVGVVYCPAPGGTFVGVMPGG